MPLYDTILVGIDFNPLSDIALDAAAALSERPGARPIRAVLAAIDLSPISERVLAEAARAAAALNAQLTVLSLYEIPLILNGRPLPIVIPETIEGLEEAYRARVEKLVDTVKR